MAEPEEILEARTPADLGPMFEVLLDQEFHFLELVHDPRSGTVSLVVRRSEPPRPGTWLLQVRQVRAWRLDRRGGGPTDVLRGALHDPMAKRLTLRFGSSAGEAEVGELDVVLRRVDGPPPKEGGPAKPREIYPAWFREEVRKADAEAEAKREGVRRVRWNLVLKASGASTLVTLLVGGLAVGSFPTLLLLAPVASGGTAALLLIRGTDHATGGLFLGLASLLACILAGFHNILAAVLATLFLAVFQMLVLLWIREEASLRL